MTRNHVIVTFVAMYPCDGRLNDVLNKSPVFWGLYGPEVAVVFPRQNRASNTLHGFLFRSSQNPKP